MKNLPTFLEFISEDLRYSGNDITKMPIIGELETKVLKFAGGDIPSTKHFFVEVISDSSEKYYVTNIWYKNRIPLVIHEDMVEKIKMYNKISPN